MSFLPQLAPPFIDTNHTRRLRTPLHTRLPSHDLLAEHNTYQLHLDMMRLLTLALLFGVGAAITSRRAGDGTSAKNELAVAKQEHAKAMEAAKHSTGQSTPAEEEAAALETLAGKACEGTIVPFLKFISADLLPGDVCCKELFKAKKLILKADLHAGKIRANAKAASGKKYCTAGVRVKSCAEQADAALADSKRTAYDKKKVRDRSIR